MAEHPGEAFALTDLVRALKLSRATCHALLTGLVEVGYLYRTGDKTYVLGPALAAIGRTAAEHYSPMQIAKPEMRSLADEYDVVCGAYFLEGDIMHLRDRAASASHVAYPVPLGTRMKIRSAQVAAYFAWSPEEAEEWLAHATPRPSDEAIEMMHGSIDFTRKHGFTVLVRNPGAVMAGRVNPRELVGTETDELPVIPVADVQPDQVYLVGALMAPVFDSRGKVSFSLVMAGFQSGMKGSELLAAGEQLRDAGKRISGFVAGRALAAA